jgi:hypothetical protein
VPRKHLKKDDRLTWCGLSMNAKFQKQLAQDRQSVTCGACELVTRPKTAPAPKPEPVDLYVGGAVEPGAPLAEAPVHAAEMPPV